MNNHKTALRALALTLVMAMALTGCSAVITNPVVAKIGDVEVTYSQFYNMFSTYASYGMIDTTTAEGLAAGRQQIFDQLIDAALPVAKAKLDGLTLTEEELTAAKETAAAEVDSYLSEYLDETIENEDERQAAAIKAFNKAYKESGYTYDKIVAEVEASSIDNALGVKLTEQIKAAAVAATDDEAKAWYDAQVETEREKYAADAAAYYTDNQYYTYYGNVRPLVTPEGMFYVKHILINVEDAAAADETVLSSSEADFSNTELTDEQKAEAAKAEAKARAEEVLAKVEADGDFDALIAEYGEDPGMQAEPAMTQGYPVAEGYDTVYDEAFYKAAIALKQTGDTTGLVESAFGYHIIRRVGDASAEPVAFDEVKADILTFLNTQKQTEAYNAALEAWREAVSVTQYDKRVQYIGVNQ